MKTKLVVKTTLLSFLAIFIFSNLTFGQSSPSVDFPEEDRLIQHDVFVCPDDAVFSKVNQSVYGAAFCQQGYEYYIAADAYTASRSFTKFRFWGGDFYGCTMLSEEPFDVFIWNGNPSSGGTLVYSATLNGTVTNIGAEFLGTNTYQIDIDLGTSIHQLSGWIGITRKNTTCDWAFGWLVSDESGNGMNYGYGSWEGDYNFMFCLSGEPPVPVSNWALYMGGLLIVLFAAVFFRRIYS